MDHAADMLKMVLDYARLKGWNDTRLCSEIGITPQTLSNWKKRGGMSAESILPTIERLGIAVSPWLRSQLKLSSDVLEGPAIKGRVPLISWVQAGAWSDAADPFSVGDAEDWLPCPVSHGPRTFCLRVRGLSMYNPSGRYSYREGEIIFVDPDRRAEHGDRVVVRLEDQRETTFKQLIEEGTERYLRALNPSWPEQIIRINGEATICGVVIGKWSE